MTALFHSAASVPLSGDLYRLTGRQFCLGLIVDDDKVVFAAPYLRKTLLHRRLTWLRVYCQKKRWKLERVKGGMG